MLAQLRDGVRYAAADHGIRWLVLGVTLVSLLASPLVALLPAYARDVLGGDARTLGVLTGCLGAGSLVGSFLLGQFGDRVTPARLIGGAILGLGLATAGVAIAPGLALTGAAVVFTGLFRLGSMASSNSRLQTRTDDAFRGRVMSLFMLAFAGAYPIGALAAGALAEIWGVQALTLGMALGTAGVGALVWRQLARHGGTPVTAPAIAAAPRR